MPDAPLVLGATARAEELRRFGRGSAAGLDDDLGASARLGAGLPFTVDVHVDVSYLTPEYRTAIWFICSEALTNAAKHAQPSRVTVSVELGEQDAVLVTVRDDGRGGARVDRGNGLRGIRQRAEALGGLLAVESEPDAGTVVCARLPAILRTVATRESDD